MFNTLTKNKVSSLNIKKWQIVLSEYQIFRFFWLETLPDAENARCWKINSGEP